MYTYIYISIYIYTLHVNKAGVSVSVCVDVCSAHIHCIAYPCTYTHFNQCIKIHTHVNTHCVH